MPDPQSVAIPLDELARAANRLEDQAREIERLQDCLHEAHQNFEQRTRERDRLRKEVERLQANNAQVYDALRIVVEFVRSIFGAKYDDELKTVLDLLAKEHPGEALLQAHAADVQRLELARISQTHRAETAEGMIRALREALRDRGRARCPTCAGTGKLSNWTGDEWVECACRKELFG